MTANAAPSQAPQVGGRRLMTHNIGSTKTGLTDDNTPTAPMDPKLKAQSSKPMPTPMPTQPLMAVSWMACQLKGLGRMARALADHQPTTTNATQAALTRKVSANSGANAPSPVKAGLANSAPSD